MQASISIMLNIGGNPLYICAVLSPFWYVVLWISCLGLPALSVLSTQLRESTRLDYSSSSLHHGLGILKAVNLGNVKIHIICFPSLRDHCSLLLEKHCLEHCFSCIFVCVFKKVVSGRKVNSVPFNMLNRPAIYFPTLMLFHSFSHSFCPLLYSCNLRYINILQNSR